MFAIFSACLAPNRRCGFSLGTTAAANAAAASRRKVSAARVCYKTKPTGRRGSRLVRNIGRLAKTQHKLCTRASPAPLLASSSEPFRVVAATANGASRKATTTSQPCFSPSYVITDAMPVRSRFMNPLDFLSSSEPLMLTPEEKAEEMAEKARVAELKNDAKALAAALAQELAERKAKTAPAVVTKPRRPTVQAPSRPRRYGTQQQHLPSLPPRSPKLAPVTPRPPRRHKASAKSERARVKTLKRWRKPKPPHRPQTPAAQRAFSIPRERSRSPKMPASTQRSRRKTHQTPQRQSGRQPMRRTAAARIRAAAAAASSRSTTSHKPRASRSGKKLPAVRPHRAMKVHASVVMRPRPKSTVKTWRLKKSKKRAVMKARCGKRQKAY